MCLPSICSPRAIALYDQDHAGSHPPGVPAIRRAVFAWREHLPALRCHPDRQRERRVRKMKRFIGLVAAALLLLGSGARPAGAHTEAQLRWEGAAIALGTIGVIAV